jgi:DNA-binding IclR family transcriptional regulator
MRDQVGVHTVSRALQMLSAFEEGRRELAVRDFAALLDVHKSTASRLAATLAARGFLERVPGRDTFTLGPQVARIGHLAVGARPLAELARATMEELAADTGETVVLSVPAGEEALDIAQTGSAHVIGATSWIGRRTPLHASSDGKTLLAFGAAELPDAPLAQLSEHTVTDAGELERQLAEARANGWAIAVGDYENGLNGVAAPVFGTGGCVAALSVSGPAYRIPVERLPELGGQCAEAANAISARLGHTSRTGVKTTVRSTLKGGRES